jgi:hypothetical protein
VAALKLVRPAARGRDRPEGKVFGGALGGLFMRHLGQRRAIANTFAALVSLWQRNKRTSFAVPFVRSYAHLPRRELPR